MSFDLKLHAYRLLIEEPFFAALSRKIEKKENYGIPTAGVRVNPESGHFEMAYNPDFFEKLSDVEKAGVLKHEFYHLIFDHVTTRKPEGVSSGTSLLTWLSIATWLVSYQNSAVCLVRVPLLSCR